MTKLTKAAPVQRPMLGAPERSADERSETARSGGEPNIGRTESGGTRSNETVERPRRRTFTAEYKNRILDAVDACEPGAIGKMLRQEGLYSSHLTDWRRERDAGGLAGLGPKRRGPALRAGSAERKEIEKLQRKVAALEQRLEHAQVIIDIQKKLHDVLGIPLGSPSSSGETARSNSSKRSRR
jgi:transposase-like protein